MISPGLIIGIPTRHAGYPVPIDWAWAFKSMHPPINFNLVIHQIQGKPVAEARNEIAAEAIKNNAKYLFFLGDDVVCPNHTLKQLIFRMENNPQIGVCGGVYCSKCDPPAPLVFRGNGKGSFWDWKIGEFFEVTGLGMDATLIRVEVFNKIAPPWFKTTDSDKFLEGVNEADQWTEDLYFLKRVLEETEYKIYCDASVICDHWDVLNRKKYTLPAYSLPTRKFNFENKKRILDIGCGEIRREFEEGIPVRVDIDEKCNPDYRADVRQLPFGDAEFDIVFSSHVLEHFNREEWRNVLSEWLRVLRKDGELRLILPNIKWAAEEICKDRVNNDVLNVLYGAQTDIWDYHKNGFTPDVIGKYLNELGLNAEISFSGYNIIISARYKDVESGVKVT